MSTKAGEVPNQTTQKVTCISEQMGMPELGAPDNHCLSFLPGVVILEARASVMVFGQNGGNSHSE